MHMSLLSKRWKFLSTNEVEHFEWVPFWLASSIFFGVPIYRKASAKAFSDLLSLEATVAVAPAIHHNKPQLGWRVEVS